MNSRRTVILVVAVVVGAIASFGLLNYIRNVEGSVYENAEPETVWVVQRPIAKGTSIDQVLNQGLIGESEIPASFRPATAIVDPETELAGLVAVTDLPANAPLVTGNFVAPSVVNTGITDRLEERGLTTVTFSLDQVKGAAYLLEPGDRVNVLSLKALGELVVATGGTEIDAEADSEDGSSESTGSADADAGTRAYDYDARYVYQNVEILAIDKSLTPDLGESTDEQETAARNGGMITLAVPPEAVQLILSVGTENLYLSLVPPSYEPYELPPLDLGDQVLPGENGDELTPYSDLEAPTPAP
ncbi:MAG: RcpC/CpaB family pilus assembly protein [Actinomycetota bacterium]